MLIVKPMLYLSVNLVIFISQLVIYSLWFLNCIYYWWLVYYKGNNLLYLCFLWSTQDQLNLLLWFLLNIALLIYQVSDISYCISTNLIETHVLNITIELLVSPSQPASSGFSSSDQLEHRDPPSCTG